MTEIIISDRIRVNTLSDGSVSVMRPSMHGEIVTHVIKSPYSGRRIADWLIARIQGTAALVQREFPYMDKGDREFLMTGITPTEWLRLFGSDEEE